MRATRIIVSPHDAVTLAAVLAQPWVDVVFSGAASVEHLNSNLDAERIARQPLDEQLRFLAESPAEYGATRARLPWD